MSRVVLADHVVLVVNAYVTAEDESHLGCLGETHVQLSSIPSPE